jgi:hypothetical protein
LILGKHIINDAFFVLSAKVYHLKGDAQGLCYEHGIIAIFYPGAFIVEGYGLVMPIAHEKPYYFMSLLYQEVRRNAAVYSSA